MSRVLAGYGASVTWFSCSTLLDEECLSLPQAFNDIKKHHKNINRQYILMWLSLIKLDPYLVFSTDILLILLLNLIDS